MSMPETLGKLTDRKVLIFDVYGTLMDWESGIYEGLKNLVSRFSASRNWSRKEVLAAFGSVELDLQSQFPDMLYADLLAKVYEVLEERLKALSTKEGISSTLSGALGHVTSTPTEDPTAETSAAGAIDALPSSSSQSRECYSSEDAHKAFGNSVKNWPIFPDTSAALHSLSKHFKLVVLSNVDRDSFQYTHGILSEGHTPSDPSPYLYPGEATLKTQNLRYWHPQATDARVQSPWTLLLTAQDTGCYKPALGGFETALEYIKTNPELLGGKLEDGKDVKDKVLIVAQSLPHDHVPASQLGVKSVWIDRQSAVTCNELPGEQKPYSWRFATLGELAKTVEEGL